MRELLAREDKTLPISQELKHRRVKEAQRLHQRANRIKAAIPINRETVRRALETEQFVIAAAGRRLGISESQMLVKARKLLPDFEQRRKEVREKVERSRREFRANTLLTALQQNQFNIAATARTMDKSLAWVHIYVRDLLPDFDRMRADYLAEHSLGRCGGHIETEEEHAQRLLLASQARSRTALLVNSRRWSNTEERAAKKREKLQQLEAQLQEMNRMHVAEKEAIYRELQALEKRQHEMRKRQVKERHALNTAITQARIAIPGYRESLNIPELRRKREAEKMRRNREALDRTNGDSVKAAQLLGLDPSHLRKFKKTYWHQPQQEPHAQSPSHPG
jgi:transcriptional regulator with GAF, ATPase, and Fis domain